MEYCLNILDEDVTQKKKKGKLSISQNCIKLLCLICTPRTNKFYIPGETNLAERIRKRAFDSGTFTLLTFIYHELKEKSQSEQTEIKDHIREKVLNFADINDLTYHVRLLKALKEKQEKQEK